MRLMVIIGFLSVVHTAKSSAYWRQYAVQDALVIYMYMRRSVDVVLFC